MTSRKHFLKTSLVAITPVVVTLLAFSGIISDVSRGICFGFGLASVLSAFLGAMFSLRFWRNQDVSIYKSEASDYVKISIFTAVFAIVFYFEGLWENI